MHSLRDEHAHRKSGPIVVSGCLGLRANASRCSHAELDAMTTLDDGDPDDLDGCCGTDHRRVAAIAAARTGATRPR